jgi:hypothetical protein
VDDVSLVLQFSNFPEQKIHQSTLDRKVPFDRADAVYEFHGPQEACMRMLIIRSGNTLRVQRGLTTCGWSRHGPLFWEAEEEDRDFCNMATGDTDYEYTTSEDGDTLAEDAAETESYDD